MVSRARWGAGSLPPLSAGIGLCSAEGKRLPTVQIILLFASCCFLSRQYRFRMGAYHLIWLVYILHIVATGKWSENLPLRIPQKEGRRKQWGWVRTFDFKLRILNQKSLRFNFKLRILNLKWWRFNFRFRILNWKPLRFNSRLRILNLKSVRFNFRLRILN